MCKFWEQNKNLEGKKKKTIFVWQFGSPPYYQLTTDWENIVNNQKIG